jgi:uridine kinase
MRSVDDQVAAAAARVSELVRLRVGTSQGPVVVGIDGPSGSGKSTLAAAVAAAVDCPIVHMDDLFPGWDGLAAATGLLFEQVLRPLAEGRPGGYRRWDWDASAWAGTVAVPLVPVLVVEGCASTVRPAGDLVDVRVWVEAAPDVRMSRGIERDGEAFRPHWERWAAQERALFAADRTRERADLIVRN